MPPRTPPRRQSVPRKSPPAGKAPIVGLAVVVLLATALAFRWSSHRVPVSVARVAAQSAPAAPFFSPRHIYSETANPRAEIAAALEQAKRQRKRVLLDFGADWCPDCQVLALYLHQPPNAELLDQNFVLVSIWIGQMDTNLDLAAHYGVPIAKGVPALAVLDADGRVLYAQKTGEFNKMSHMDAASVTEFLQAWKI